MNAKILKFPRSKKKPARVPVNAHAGNIVIFPEAARPTLTRRIAQDVCHF